MGHRGDGDVTMGTDWRDVLPSRGTEGPEAMPEARGVRGVDPFGAQKEPALKTP